jgi:hypothetical protein
MKKTGLSSRVTLPLSLLLLLSAALFPGTSDTSAAEPKLKPVPLTTKSVAARKVAISGTLRIKAEPGSREVRIPVKGNGLSQVSSIRVVGAGGQTAQGIDARLGPGSDLQRLLILNIKAQAFLGNYGFEFLTGKGIPGIVMPQDLLSLDVVRVGEVGGPISFIGGAGSRPGRGAPPGISGGLGKTPPDRSSLAQSVGLPGTLNPKSTLPSQGGVGDSRLMVGGVDTEAAKKIAADAAAASASSGDAAKDAAAGATGVATGAAQSAATGAASNAGSSDTKDTGSGTTDSVTATSSDTSNSDGSQTITDTVTNNRSDGSFFADTITSTRDKGGNVTETRHTIYRDGSGKITEEFSCTGHECTPNPEKAGCVYSPNCQEIMAQARAMTAMAEQVAKRHMESKWGGLKGDSLEPGGTPAAAGSRRPIAPGDASQQLLNPYINPNPEKGGSSSGSDSPFGTVGTPPPRQDPVGTLPDPVPDGGLKPKRVTPPIQ